VADYGLPSTGLLGAPMKGTSRPEGRPANLCTENPSPETCMSVHGDGESSPLTGGTCEVCATTLALGWLGDSGMSHCRSCHRTWTGQNAGHCTRCHRHFASESAFRYHQRIGPPLVCVPPEQLVDSHGDSRLALKETRWGSEWARVTTNDGFEMRWQAGEGQSGATEIDAGLRLRHTPQRPEGSTRYVSQHHGGLLASWDTGELSEAISSAEPEISC
jgi:hypothetical protein